MRMILQTEWLEWFEDVSYTQYSLMKEHNLNPQTAVTIIKRLKNYGLIEEVRQYKKHGRFPTRYFALTKDGEAFLEYARRIEHSQISVERK